MSRCGCGHTNQQISYLWSALLFIISSAYQFSTRFGACLWGFVHSANKSIGDIRHWFRAKMTRAESKFRFIPKEFNGVEVKALFFHLSSFTPTLVNLRACSVHRGIMLEQNWGHFVPVKGISNATVCKDIVFVFSNSLGKTHLWMWRWAGRIV